MKCMLKTLLCEDASRTTASAESKRLILQIPTVHGTLVESAVTVYPIHIEYEEE